jgi:hypothetical protein
VPDTAIAEFYPQAGMYSGYYYSDLQTGSQTINMASIAYGLISSKLTGYDGAKLWAYPRFVVEGIPYSTDRSMWWVNASRLGSYRYSDTGDFYPYSFLDRYFMQLPPMKYWINLRPTLAYRWTQTHPASGTIPKWIAVPFGSSTFTSIIRNSTELINYTQNSLFGDKIEFVLRGDAKWKIQFTFIFECYKLPTKDSTVDAFILMPF